MGKACANEDLAKAKSAAIRCAEFWQDVIWSCLYYVINVTLHISVINILYIYTYVYCIYSFYIRTQCDNNAMAWTRFHK